MKKIRVAIVDDHAVVRMGLKYALALMEDLELVGEHSDGIGVVPFIHKTHPDVVLLDIRMPGKDGISALEDILSVYPQVKVVMLTTSGTEEDVYRSLQRGAHGYVLKDRDPKDIVMAIRTVAAGSHFIPDEIREIYQAGLMMPKLTSREMDVLKFMAQGCANREIAEKMEISEDGVKLHLRHVYVKLGAKDRVSALAIAIQKGIISAP